MTDRVREPTVRELLDRRDRLIKQLILSAIHDVFEHGGGDYWVQDEIKSIDFLLGAGHES